MTMETTAPTAAEDAPSAADAAALFRARAAFYRMLASLYFAELTDEGIERLRATDWDALALGVPEADEGLRAMATYLARCGSAGRQELAVDFAGAILAAGSYEERCATPYESVFTSETGLLMQEARDDVYRYYCEAEIGVDPTLQTPEDHFSFECEFMAALAERTADALEGGDPARAAELTATQASFHRDHLANWVDDLCDTLTACARTRFYRGVAQLTRSFIHEDTTLLAELTTTSEQLAA